MSDILKVNPNSKFERNLLKTNKRYDSTNWWHFTDFPMLLGTNLNPSCLYLALTCLIFWLWRTASYYFSTHCSPRHFSEKYLADVKFVRKKQKSELCKGVFWEGFHQEMLQDFISHSSSLWAERRRYSMSKQEMA